MFILVLISLQGSAYGYFLNDFFSESGSDISVTDENSQNSTSYFYPPEIPSENIRPDSFNLPDSVSIPNVFKNLDELTKNAQLSEMMSDNYTSLIDMNPTTEETQFIKYAWNSINLNWVSELNPHGEIEVFSSVMSPETKKIVIYPDTYEKGLLLLSSALIPPGFPSYSFHMKGIVSDQDALLILAKEADNPYHLKWFAIPPGTYSNIVQIDLSEFEGQKVSLVIGAYYLSEQNDPWILQHFSLERTEDRQSDGAIILPHDDLYPQQLDSETGASGEELNPNISVIWPGSIHNANSEYHISIYGDNFQEGAEAFLMNTNGEMFSFRETIHNSNNNLSAIFSDLNMESGTYAVGVLNPDGMSTSKNAALTIYTPDKPIIHSIWPNSGQNTGLVNISELSVSNFSSGDEVFLNRAGHKPIYATRIKIISIGTSSCFFDLTGAAVGVWNLTIQKKNDKNDVCIDCFTITGPSDHYYSFVQGWQIMDNDNNISPDIEGAAFDISDNLMVTDSAHDHIRKYSPDGQLLLKWGKSGTGEGEFIDPSDIAISSTGSVYIVDKGNERIQKFSPEGLFETMWGEQGTLEGQFRNPSGISIDSMDNVYVSDTHNHRIQKFDQNGVFLKSYGIQGGINGHFNYPTDLVTNYENNLYVLDNGNDRIQKFDEEGEFLAQWGSPGFESGQFLSPGSLATDSMSNVFVTDLSNHQVQKFNATGSFLTKWGSEGSEEGQFQCPNAIAVNSTGYVYVIDCRDNRVQIFKMIEDSQFFTPYQEEIEIPISDNYTVIPEEEPTVQPTDETYAYMYDEYGYPIIE